MKPGDLLRNIIVLLCICSITTSIVSGQTFTAEQIEKTISDFRSYDYSKDPAVTLAIDNIVKYVILGLVRDRRIRKPLSKKRRLQ